MGRAASQTFQSSTGNKYNKPLHPVRQNEFAPLSHQPKRPSTAPITTIEPVRRAFSENVPASSAVPTMGNVIGSRSIEPVRRAFSENENASYIPPPPPPPKPTNVLSTLMRRKKANKSGSEPETQDPPPIPPKDKEEGYSSMTQQHEAVNTFGAHGVSISEFAVMSNGMRGKPPPPLQQTTPTLPLGGKWAPRAPDVEERLRQRKEAEQRRKEDEKEALRQEKRRQEKARKRKEDQRREDIEEDERKRMDLEDELRRAAQERKLKEQMEKHEEERKRLELEERKRIDKERRMEEHKRLEEWRREQAKLAEEVARNAEDARKKEEFERKRKIALAEAKVKNGRSVESLTTGWVTMQTNNSVTWKRKFYKFIGTAVYFYRSPTVRVPFPMSDELKH